MAIVHHALMTETEAHSTTRRAPWRLGRQRAADSRGCLPTSTALLTLGERESDRGCLEQAVDAYRAALSVLGEHRAPQTGVLVKGNLARALEKLSA